MSMELKEWEKYPLLDDDSIRFRRLAKPNMIIAVEVSRVINNDEYGWDLGWSFIIYDMTKKFVESIDNIETKELALFMADLKLISLGYKLNNPFDFRCVLE